jgi:voltage-gated potassium channel
MGVRRDTRGVGGTPEAVRRPASRYRRHGKAIRPLLRAAVSAVLMVVVYYRAPLDRPLDARVATWLALGLVFLGASLAWQVRSIATSETPRARAVETVATGLPLLLLLYASAYSLVSVDQPASFTEVLGRTDALYFTLTVFATVGFGDIAPVSETARILTMTQMVVGLLVVGVVAHLLVGAVHKGIDRRAEADAPAEDRPPGERGRAATGEIGVSGSGGHPPRAGASTYRAPPEESPT